MLLIVASHLGENLEWEYAVTDLSSNRVWIVFLNIGGKLGVNIFILISGYFMINSNRIKVEKIVGSWLQMLFYSVGIYILLSYLGLCDFSFSMLKYIFKPVSSEYWHFANRYIILCFLSPFINLFLKSLSKRDYVKFLFVVTMIWSVIPTIIYASFELSSMLWFIVLYCYGGYIREYVDLNNIRTKNVLIYAILSVLVAYLLSFLMMLIGKNIERYRNFENYFFQENNICELLITICVLLIFLKIDIGNRKFVNIVASSTFGIFLIHENKYVVPVLWDNIARLKSMQYSEALIPYTIICVIGVFVVLSIIDLLRIYLIERPLDKLICSISDNLEYCGCRVFNWVYNKL